MKKIAFIILISALFTGCASVKMESLEKSGQAKKFAAPTTENAGLYFYRSNFVGKALKRDIWVDGNCVGTSANDVFFYTEVLGGKSHVLATESEFSPNELSMFTDVGKNYFIRQNIKMGVLVGGAVLEVTPEDEGKEAVAKLEMATSGSCKSN